MKISYIKNISSFDIINKTIEDLDIPQLCTEEKIKIKSAAFNLNEMTARDKSPKTVSGFIIDWDYLKKPILNKKYTYIYHQTHRRWRIIVPFEKPQAFSNSLNYKQEVIRCVMDVVVTDKTIDELVTETKEGRLDPKSFTPTQFYFMRPVKNPLTKNEGEFWKPEFRKLAPGKIIFSSPSNFSKKISKGQNILMRMKEFYEYYKTNMNFKFIKHDKNRCRICEDLDDSPNDNELKLNNGTQDYIATIKCFHTNCHARLKEAMQAYLPVDKKTGEVTPIYDFNYSILYLAYSIIHGKLSLDQVDACGFYNNLHMLLNQQDLRFLHYNAKKDMPIWLKILHDGIILEPHQKTIYHYEEGYYKPIDKDILRAYYHDSAGTYAAYRYPRLNSKEYVERIAEFGKGRMLQNYNKVVKKDGINLKNGSFIWEGDGQYSFNPPTPNIFYTHQLPFAYDERKKCTLWLKILTDYFGDSRSKQAYVLQEFFGYCLTYDRRFEKLLVLFGIPGGGKNTIMRILTSLIPTEVSSMGLLCSPKDNEFMINKKLIIVNETIGKFREGTVNTLKKLASTDAVQVRPLYSSAFSLDEVPKIALTFNTAPESMQIDEALRQRMLTLKLTRGFRDTEKEDVFLNDKLKKELPGIFNWALEGYIRLYQRGRFTKYLRDTKELYDDANEEDLDLLSFLQTAKEKEACWLSSDLYDYYMTNFTLNDQILSSHLFGRAVKRLGAGNRRTSKGVTYDLSTLKAFRS